MTETEDWQNPNNLMVGQKVLWTPPLLQNPQEYIFDGIKWGLAVLLMPNGNKWNVNPSEVLPS